MRTRAQVEHDLIVAQADRLGWETAADHLRDEFNRAKQNFEYAEGEAYDAERRMERLRAELQMCGEDT